MRIESFTSIVRNHLDRFEREWMINNERFPDDWPLDSLHLADWFEQFDLFIEDPRTFVTHKD
jgi:hypothetical protein